MRHIRGAGGGGKDGGGSQARVPTEAKDSLQSLANAKVLDLLSEGPIAGLVDGLKSIYLDETPIQNADGSYNFKNLQFDFRNGTQSQNYIPMFSDVENEISVATRVKNSVPVVRTVSSSDVDAVRLRISIPQMTEQNTSTGDLAGSRVRIAIDVQSNGGGYVEQFQDQIIGKSTSKYERQYLVRLTGGAPYDIRIRRITADSVSVAVQNETYWESYTQVIDSKLRYPNSALVGVQIDSSQFQSIPTRAYDIKGLIIQVPSNYDAASRVYTGVWDGTYTSQYSSNPAWIFYDLLTNTRYGLGNYIQTSQIDKWSLYTIGKYCDELVSDGFGGTEPRYTMNTYIQTRQEAFSLLQTLASAFNSMIYWAAGSITLTQDSPSDPAFLFTPANVVEGLFNYSGASAKTKHSVALVTWNDPEDFYRQKIEYVEDAESIAQFGVVETQVVAFGCTSRGQAHRYGKWLLYTERAQSEVVSFKTGLEASICRPGQIIKIQDPARAGARLGGRIQSATTTQITIDQTCDFAVDGSTLTIVKEDGSLESKPILSTSGNVITLASALSAAPAKNTIWLVELSNVEAQYFRIINITEADGGEHEITAVAHDLNKFDYIENNLELEPAQVSLLNVVPAAPIGLQITETLYEANGDVRVKVTISWNTVPFASTYSAQYRKDGGNIVVLPETSSNEVEIFDAEPGSYEVTVTAINSVGTNSQSSTITRTVVGKAAPPADVSGFSLIPQANMAYLSWDKATDLDVLRGGYVRIRFSPLTVGATWKDSFDVAPGLAGSATRAQVPLLEGTYFAKFIDSSGNASMNAVEIVTSAPEYYNLNVVQTITESPTFSSTSKTNMEYNLALAGLVLSAATLVDDIVDIDSVPSWDFAGGVQPTGSYEFMNYFDLGEVHTCKITANLEVQSVDVADYIDFRTANIDDWDDLDGVNIDDTNVEMFVSTTEDDPSGTPTWTEWKRFIVGEYSARAFKFKIEAKSGSDYHNVVVKALGVTIDMPDRDEKFRNVASGATTYTVTYSKPFRAIPAVAITAYNMNTGDYWTISNQTVSGFDITFKNSGGSAVDRTFDVLARGYGRKLN